MNELLRNIFGPLTDLLGAGLPTFHDWGAPPWLAIFALTVIVRTILFPLTAKQVKNMRRLQELKPELDELRARHKDDPQKQQEALTKLYGERGINPLGGCMPVLIQLPIFLALYYTIKSFEASESMLNGGLFWFRNLTVPDPYYILPIVYVLTMMASQHLTIKYTAPSNSGSCGFCLSPSDSSCSWVASHPGSSCTGSPLTSSPYARITSSIAAPRNKPSPLKQKRSPQITAIRTRTPKPPRNLRIAKEPLAKREAGRSAERAGSYPNRPPPLTGTTRGAPGDLRERPG